MSASPNTPAPAPAPPQARRSRRGLKILGFTFLTLTLLLVVAFFVATSSRFIQSTILPRVSKSLNADITVDDISLKVFSGATLKNLKIQSPGKEPLLTATEVVVRYPLGQLMKGNLLFHEITLRNPVIQLVEDADGDQNLDPILQAMTKSSEEGDGDSESESEPLQLQLDLLTIENGTVRQVKHHDATHQDIREVKGLNLKVTDLGNGSKGTIEMAGHLNLDLRPPAPATNFATQASLAGKFALELTAELLPANAQGKLTIKVTNAGTSPELKDLETELAVDLTPTEIKDLGLRFKRGPQSLGEVQVQGPFNPNTLDGDLSMVVRGIDRQVLQLAGASLGMDFGQTSLSSTNRIKLTSGANQIEAQGELLAKNFSISQAGQTTPVLQGLIAYGLQIDRTKELATVNQLRVDFSQSGRPFLQSKLNRPMPVSWGAASNQALGDSDLQFTITNLNLTDWKAFIGTNAPQGHVDAVIDVVSQQGGKILNLNLNSTLRDVALSLGSNQVAGAGGKIQVKAKVSEFNQVDLSELAVTLNQKQAEIFSLKGNGSLRVDTQEVQLQTELKSSLPGLLTVFPIAETTFSSGDLSLVAKITQEKAARSLVGTLALTQMTGRSGTMVFNQYETRADLDLQLKDQLVDIKKALGKLGPSGQPQGEFNLAGRYDIGLEKGTLQADLKNFTEHSLKPFLQSALGDKELKSVRLEASLGGAYDAKGESSVKGSLSVTNLVVRDPSGSIPETPLFTRVELDGTLKDQLIDLKQATLHLSGTERAKNSLSIKARHHMATNSSTPTIVSIESDGLDLTTYYALLDQPAPGPASTSTATKGKAKPGDTASSRDPEPVATEPEPMTLPISKGTFSVKIAKLYLRDLAITNFNTQAEVDRGVVTVQPFQWGVNGKPVTGSGWVNLARKGYEYEMKFNAALLAIGPFVSAFMPESKGRYEGDLSAVVDLKGAGITGPSLQKNLRGTSSLIFTNANIQLAGPKMKAFFTPIALALRAPELLETPINWANIQAQMGNGKIAITNLQMLSSTFMAETTGEIPIREDLMASPITKWPMTFSLRRNLADKIKMVPKDAPTNQAYVKLPNFLRVSGTLGEPKPEIDTVALAGGLLERFGGQIGDEKTGKILEGIGGIIGGKGGTNKVGVGEVLDLFNKKDKKK